jgi:hypothetical protein
MLLKRIKGQATEQIVANHKSDNELTFRIYYKKKKKKKPSKLNRSSPGTVAYDCNPSYSGGRDQEDGSLK